MPLQISRQEFGNCVLIGTLHATKQQVMKIVEQTEGYSPERDDATASIISLADLEKLKRSVGFTREDELFLHLAGAVLADQTRSLVDRCLSTIAETPQLARYSQKSEKPPIDNHSPNIRQRFQHWILDTCLRPYDQNWLNRQQEVALRHSVIKNGADGVDTAPCVPLYEIIGFTNIINDTIKPFLGSKGHNEAQVEKMHSAWCKSVLMQTALWAEPYLDDALAVNEW